MLKDARWEVAVKFVQSGVSAKEKNGGHLSGNLKSYEKARVICRGKIPI